QRRHVASRTSYLAERGAVGKAGQRSRLAWPRLAGAHLLFPGARPRPPPRPDLAVRVGPKLLDRHLPCVGDDLEERPVDVVDLASHDVALDIRVRPLIAVDRDVLAKCDRLATEEQLAPQRAGDDLSAEHSDRAGERAWPRDDPCARRRDVITARAGDRPHYHDHGLSPGDGL